MVLFEMLSPAGRVRATADAAPNHPALVAGIARVVSSGTLLYQNECIMPTSKPLDDWFGAVTLPLSDTAAPPSFVTCANVP